jgi:hypothetical protein
MREAKLARSRNRPRGVRAPKTGAAATCGRGGPRTRLATRRDIPHAPARRACRGRSAKRRARPGPAQLQLFDYLRAVYKRRWTAVTAFVLVVLAVAVNTFTSTPIYEATVQLLIEADNPTVVSFQDVRQQELQTFEFYQTQYRLLRSRDLAARVLTAEKLWDHPEFGGGPKPRPRASASAASSWPLSAGPRRAPPGSSAASGPPRAPSPSTRPSRPPSSGPASWTLFSAA